MSEIIFNEGTVDKVYDAFPNGLAILVTGLTGWLNVILPTVLWFTVQEEGANMSE